MLTGSAAPILDILLPASAFSSGTRWSPGPASAKLSSRALPLKPSTVVWPTLLLNVVGYGICSVNFIFCDNVSAVYLSDNPVHHKRTKHVEPDIHFVRERTTLGQLRVLHVPTIFSLPTSWPRGCLLRFFKISGTTSALDHTTLSLGGWLASIAMGRPVLQLTDRADCFLAFPLQLWEAIRFFGCPTMPALYKYKAYRSIQNVDHSL
jgi:hypothetical protein